MGRLRISPRAVALPAPWSVRIVLSGRTAVLFKRILVMVTTLATSALGWLIECSGSWKGTQQ